MRIIALGIALLLTTTLCYSQKNSSKVVPMPVKVDFEKRFPIVRELAWNKSGAYIVAKYRRNNLASSSVYNSKGVFMVDITALDPKRLPLTVEKSAMAANTNSRISRAYRIEDKDKHYYLIYIEGNQDTTYVAVNQDGEVVEFKLPNQVLP